MRRAVDELRREWDELDRRIAELDDEFAATARETEAVRRSAEIPGLGPRTATALAAAVGDASSFGSGRHLAAWLGLVPRQLERAAHPNVAIVALANKIARIAWAVLRGGRFEWRSAPAAA